MEKGCFPNNDLKKNPEAWYEMNPRLIFLLSMKIQNWKFHRKNQIFLIKLMVQSNFAIGNFLVALKLVIGNGSLIPICSLSNRSLLLSLTVHWVEFVIKSINSKPNLIQIAIFFSVEQPVTLCLSTKFMLLTWPWYRKNLFSMIFFN